MIENFDKFIDKLQVINNKEPVRSSKVHLRFI